MEIIFGQQTTKVKQLADLISQDISMGRYKVDDALPSINQLSRDYKVSRDTVFKAFIDLKERGIIDSTPGKGYYVVNRKAYCCCLMNIPHLKTPFTIALSSICLPVIRSIYGFTNIMRACSMLFFVNPWGGIINTLL